MMRTPAIDRYGLSDEEYIQQLEDMIEDQRNEILDLKDEVQWLEDTEHDLRAEIEDLEFQLER